MSGGPGWFRQVKMDLEDYMAVAEQNVRLDDGAEYQSESEWLMGKASRGFRQRVHEYWVKCEARAMLCGQYHDTYLRCCGFERGRSGWVLSADILRHMVANDCAVEAALDSTGYAGPLLNILLDKVVGNGGSE